MDADPTRRRIVAGLALLASAPACGRLAPTPAQMPGPFYPVDPPLTQDNDLTRVAGSSAAAAGAIADVLGRVLDLDGRPIAGARVEIWQCDANGRYRHPRDRGGPVDPNFQGFGHTLADADGRYRFRSIRPVPYPGRTPHIHFAVFPPAGDVFVTQLYVAGEPRNARDLLYNAIPPERRRLVTAEFRPGPATPLRAVFDIVLGGRDGTPAG